MTVTARVRLVAFSTLAVSFLVMLVGTVTGLGPTTELGARIVMTAILAAIAAMIVLQSTGGYITTESRLRAATDGWAAPFLVRQYTDDRNGHGNAQAEATILAAHGYGIAGQAGVGGHLNVGRTLTGALLTGGISLLFGGSRTSGTVDITYVRC
jgi:hypothetical protein